MLMSNTAEVLPTAPYAGPKPSATKERTPFRKDIEGLRAVAVLPVVAYHAGMHLARGGFVGVDVFFVISGFLITQLLFRDIRTERFSILVFYERRIRRILPALLAVLLATFVLAAIYCLPAEMVDLSKSLVAAALSVSNLFFWLTSGYFDGPASAKPLLHTWSLAVEEQFYIFWPLFLLLGWRFWGQRLLPITLAVAGASLVVSAFGAFMYPDATFYLPFTRIWELAAGGLLALGALPQALGRQSRNLLAVLGMALIVASVFMIDSDMPFPGLLAVPPCAGAVLIILAGRDGDYLVGRLLALPPVAFIGAISYSLYLWHWPITVFQKNYAFLASGLTETAGKLLIIGVSLVVAVLSWKFIEQPIRSGPRRPANRLLMQMAAAGTTFVVALAAVAWASNGFPARYSASELRMASYLGYNPHDTWRIGSCFLSGGKAAYRLAPECLAVAPGKKNSLLLGDSHAAQLWVGLSSTFPDQNFLEASAADCFPTVIHSVTESSRCTVVMDRVYKEFLARHRIDNVILVARWKPALLENVAATLDWMAQRHIHVTLVGPSALYDSPLPRLMVSAMRATDSTLVTRHLNGEMPALDSAMSRLASSRGVDYISLLTLQCAETSCAMSDSSGPPLIFDQEHFTADGSVLIAQRMRDANLIR